MTTYEIARDLAPLRAGATGVGAASSRDMGTGVRLQLMHTADARVVGSPPMRYGVRLSLVVPDIRGVTLPSVSSNQFIYVIHRERLVIVKVLGDSPLTVRARL